MCMHRVLLKFLVRKQAIVYPTYVMTRQDQKETQTVRITVFSCFLVVAVVLCAADARGATWYVDGGAAAGQNGLSWAAAFDTITDGLDALSATNKTVGHLGNHLVLVTNGVYTETVTINTNHSSTTGAPVELRAVNPGQARIERSGGSYGIYIFRQDLADRIEDVIVDGFVVGHPTDPNGVYYPILADRCPRLTLRNCVTYGCYSSVSGINLQNYCEGSLISNCIVFAANTHGMYLSGTGNGVTIKNSVCIGNNYGIYVGSTTGVDIHNCLVYGNAFGGIRTANGNI